jgi:amidase
MFVSWTRAIWWLLCLVSTAAALGLSVEGPASKFPDLYEASVVELQQGLEAGHFTSVDLIKVRL